MAKIVSIALLAVALFLGAFIALRPAPAPTYADMQAQQLRIEQAQATAPAWIVAQWILIVGVPVLILGFIAIFGGIAAARFLRERKADARGRLPILRSDASGYQRAAMAALEQYHATQRTAAAIQPVPAHYAPHTSSTSNPTYSPHLSYDYKADRLTGELASEPLLSLAAGLVPSFADLLTQGRVGRGSPLLLGVNQDTGDDVTGSWLDLYSTIVSGLPGSGKTTSQRFLACQTALQGAKFVIVDPHAGAADDSLAATLAPLHAAFLCQPASDDQAILSAVQLVADIGERRIQGKDSNTFPVILWLDETTALLSRSKVAEPLAELLEEIAQEYRKKNVFACASGQIWTASRTGDDSALRDSFASVICHRMKRSQARLLVPTDEAQRVERLGTGQALLWRTSGETTVIGVPNTTAADVVRVAGLLTDNAPTMERSTFRQRSTQADHGPIVTPMIDSRNPNGTLMELLTEPIKTAPTATKPKTPESARILALFRDGNDTAEIIRQMWPDVSRGRATQEKSALVQSVIREAVAQ